MKSRCLRRFRKLHLGLQNRSMDTLQTAVYWPCRIGSSGIERIWIHTNEHGPTKVVAQSPPKMLRSR